jgi:hypothetical protein
MKHYVAFPLGSGREVVVAEVVEVGEPGGDQPAAVQDGVVSRAGETFEAALAKVKPIARAVIDTLSNVAAGVTEMEVEFGLKLNAKAGLVLASGGVEANFKVAIKWKPAQAP